MPSSNLNNEKKMDQSWQKWSPHSEKPDQSYQSHLKVRAVFWFWMVSPKAQKKKRLTQLLAVTMQLLAVTIHAMPRKRTPCQADLKSWSPGKINTCYRKGYSRVLKALFIKHLNLTTKFSFSGRFQTNICGYVFPL